MNRMSNSRQLKSAVLPPIAPVALLAWVSWLSFASPTAVTAVSAFSSPPVPSHDNIRNAALIQSVQRPQRLHAQKRSSVSILNAASSPTSESEDFSFDEMKAVEARLNLLEKEAPEMLEGFYEPHLKSFSVRPGSVESISVTSTCFALQTIFATGDCSTFESTVDFNMNPASSKGDSAKHKISIRGIIKALLRANWREEDMFQVPLLLYTILNVDKERAILNEDMDEELSYRVKQLITATLKYRPKRRNGLSQPMSDYILYLITQSLVSLVESTPQINDIDNENNENSIGLGSLPKSALPENATSLTLLALTRSVEVSYNELCRQLAFRSAGDMTSFDVMRLAYSLLTYIKASNVMAELGTAGREMESGKGPEPGTAVRPPNRRLVKAALSAFFAEQNRDGTWDKGQPIYKSFRRTGRDVGNAFVFSTDTIGTLLSALPAEDFRPHLENLQRHLTWIEQHADIEIIPDYCDPDTFQCYGKPLRGWSSPHMASQSPLAWSTAQTLTTVMRMQKVLQRLLHVDVLEEFGGVTNKGIQNLASWDRLLDTDLGDPAKGCRTLKDVLDERMIRPFSSDVPGFGAAYSAILFGPPGTAKSTICEALSDRMGWDFVVIDTSSFLADGLTNVASRIRYVFSRLQSLRQCVILFDEIEEFCLDRELPNLGMESRMLTTAMLTAINDLRRAKRSIFFLATNRLRAFDSAITRPGRFDMQLFVGTPNLESRVIQLRSQLENVAVEESVKEEAVEKFREFLSGVWEEDIMYFNYLEGLQFASACADSVRAGNELTDERMRAILKAQSVVMTVRGSVREEYDASMGLSRL